MKRALQGNYLTVSTVGEKVKAFVPSPLPPKPPIDWTPKLRSKFDEALLALGRLDSVSALLPDTSLFLYSYVRKEAVLSSMIEGTQSSLSDLMLFELDQEPGVPLEDVQEVSDYVAALIHGLNRLAEGFPLSLRLIREIHGVLLAKGRGHHKAPGQLDLVDVLFLTLLLFFLCHFYGLLFLALILILLTLVSHFKAPLPKACAIPPEGLMLPECSLLTAFLLFYSMTTRT
jgi:hypothetical protein